MLQPAPISDAQDIAWQRPRSTLYTDLAELAERTARQDPSDPLAASDWWAVISDPMPPAKAWRRQWRVKSEVTLPPGLWHIGTMDTPLGMVVCARWEGPQPRWVHRSARARDTKSRHVVAGAKPEANHAT